MFGHGGDATLQSSNGKNVSSGAIPQRRPRLDDPRDEDVRDLLLVFLPVGTVLHRAEMVVAARPVDKEDQEVDGIEVPMTVLPRS